MFLVETGESRTPRPFLAPQLAERAIRLQLFGQPVSQVRINGFTGLVPQQTFGHFTPTRSRGIRDRIGEGVPQVVWDVPLDPGPSEHRIHRVMKPSFPKGLPPVAVPPSAEARGVVRDALFLDQLQE